MRFSPMLSFLLILLVFPHLQQPVHSIEVDDTSKDLKRESTDVLQEAEPNNQPLSLALKSYRNDWRQQPRAFRGISSCFPHRIGSRSSSLRLFAAEISRWLWPADPVCARVVSSRSRISLSRMADTICPLWPNALSYALPSSRATDARPSIVCCLLDFSRFWVRYSQSMPIYADRKTRQTFLNTRTGSTFFDRSCLMLFLSFVFSFHHTSSADRFWPIGVHCRTVGLRLC